MKLSLLLLLLEHHLVVEEVVPPLELPVVVVELDLLFLRHLLRGQRVLPVLALM